MESACVFRWLSTSVLFFFDQFILYLLYGIQTWSEDKVCNFLWHFLEAVINLVSVYFTINDFFYYSIVWCNVISTLQMKLLECMLVTSVCYF